MTSSDRLFVYRPGFSDRGTDWFCPYSAQVIGYLAYYPAVRETLEIVELELTKPRRPLVDLVGEANDAAPCLVLGSASPRAVDGVTIAERQGHCFVSKTIEILRYLAATRGTSPPH
jgi:hypothetical protein